MENTESPFQSGNAGKSGPHRSPDRRPSQPDKKIETNFDSEDSESEINPSKLDREKPDIDRTGVDHSTGHEPYEFRRAAESTQGSNDSDQRSDFQPGCDSDNNQRGLSGKKSEQGRLMGQGGYGTSGTNGTSSGVKQEYQSGRGTAGSQSGSTGYDGSATGYQPKIKEVDINKLGKDVH